MSQDFSGSNIHTGHGGSGAVGGRGGDFASHNTFNTTGPITNATIHYYPSSAPPATVTPSDPGYHIPSTPDIFVGRNDVVQEIVSKILKRKHVALIGPGGTGKSSIAKAVMHNERIVSFFGSHRCFVTYDDVATSMMTHNTFLTHLARALSIADSPLLTIIAKLRASPTLLVIDNAETFLEAGTEDVGRIKSAITELGSCESVYLILTTRSTNLPNLRWFRRVVGGLDVKASRALFSAVYERDIGNRLDTLFTSLDHHALSISLLSHVAAQNEYQTTDQIIQAWTRQQTLLLKIGIEKSESLPVTIELSINSPSLQAKGAIVLELLRTIAFLPEGLHRDDLPGIFPGFTNIEATANAIYISSLTYRSHTGERLTMLAPIRMYIMDQYNASLTYQTPFLVSVRDHSYEMFSKDPESWGVRESANTERLLSFDLSWKPVQYDCDARLRALAGVDVLILALYLYHPRKTSLFPLLKTISEERLIGSQVAGVKFGRQNSKQLVLVMAQCLEHICWLQYRLHRDILNNDMLGTAESFCRKHMPTCTEQLMSCLRLKGIEYQENGNFFLADEALREASTLAHSLNDCLHVALLNHNLSQILFLRGNISEATSLMASAEEYFRSDNKHIHLVGLLLHRINVLVYEKDFETAREILGQTEELDRKHNGGRRSRRLLNKKASIEGWAGNTAAAMKLLDEATRDEIPPGMLEYNQYVDAWRAKAYYAATAGSFDDARISLTQAIKLQSETGRGSVTDDLLAAYIELYSGELGRAKDLSETMLEEDGQDHIQFTGFIHRALGEVLLLQGDRDEAMNHFGRVKSMCSASGMAPKFLYANQWHFTTLSTEYNGWIRFLDGTL